MSLEPWRSWDRLQLLAPEAWEYLLLAGLGLLTIGALAVSRRDFQRFGLRRTSLFVLLLASPLLATNVLALSFSVPDLLPPPNLPVAPSDPFVSLLGLLPVVAAGCWLGAGPALLIGLSCGLARTAITTGNVLDAFQCALIGYLVGRFLRQDYRGRVPLMLRQPVVAAPLSVVLAMALSVRPVAVHALRSGLDGLDYAGNLVWANFGSALLESVTAAIVVQAIFLVLPRIRPVSRARRFPPYSRTLNRQLLILLVPLVLAMTFALVSAVTSTTLGLAKAGAIDEMARDANGAAEDIPYFIQTGQGLLVGFADDDTLRHSDTATVEGQLRADLRTLAFFDQLTLLGPEGQIVAQYPPPPEGDPELTGQEGLLAARVLKSGAPQISAVHRTRRRHIILSFLAPIVEASSEERLGVLVGRARLEVNPMIGRVLKGLQWIRGRGEGFVVNSDNRVVAHKEPEMLLSEWYVREGGVGVPTSLRGLAYESRNPEDNTRDLVYYLPVEGYPWAVVIRVPYDVVLEQAIRTAAPLLLLQVVFGGALLAVISLVTGRLTRPLTQLGAAAGRIAEGDLGGSIRVRGDDEVARVGEAFESMRVRLKGRLEDLSLLLQISQAVSATLELPQGMPFILEGALKATGAKVLRIVLLSAAGEPKMVMARGEPRAGLGGLDRALAKAARDGARPVVVENLGRVRRLTELETLSVPIKSVIALPVRTRKLVAAVIWAGYEQPRQFDDSEVDLLSTLAGQTAVLLENARLFHVAEGGRRRLEAILRSTTDAILVTDRDNRVLLMNPAAEQVFGASSASLVGQEIGETDLAPALRKAFAEPVLVGAGTPEEIPVEDSRTLLASISTIWSADGEEIGRVAVMRDITFFKEVDEMKSDFVATVSHDLRAPLTFMRGYATMLPMVGELSEKQAEYVEKILQGVGQMGELIDDLLDLGRIEAGVGLERKRCHLSAIVGEAVESMRGLAVSKGIALGVEPLGRVAVITGDAVLLRQAIGNLVDNAIKYTSDGGSVTVGVEVLNNHAVVRASDTGIGIAPEDYLRVFERFSRVRRRATEDVQGTGLGLAIVKSIVERHNGKVWVDSELDKGSTFYISLPLSDAEDSSEAGS